MSKLNFQKSICVLLLTMLFSLIPSPEVATANLLNSESGWQATGFIYRMGNTPCPVFRVDSPTQCF